MTHQRKPGPGTAAIVAATATSLAVAGLAGLAGTSYAGGSRTGFANGPDSQAFRATAAQRAVDPFIDVTDQGAAVQTRALRTAARATRSRATRAFLTARPDQTVLDINGTTGTVRWLGRLDGFLTPRSNLVPARIALRYVRAHMAELGLVRADLSTFHLTRDYRDITGTHHLFFQQRISGTVVGRNGLTASVNRGGHLLTLGGAPVSTASAAGTVPSAAHLTITSPGAALAKTRGPVPAGSDLSQDSATRVLFPTPSGLRPAWETVVMSSAHPATTIVDAITGTVLFRQPLTAYEHSTGRVYRFFPGSRRGGRQVRVDFTRRHWLRGRARELSGNNSHTYSDVNDDNIPNRREEVRPLRGQSWGYRLRPFHLPFARSFCSNPWPCSWNPDKRFSWRVNRAQNATQVFFYVNNWHDHLLAAPIGFTGAAGNFQVRNPSGLGEAGDPVATQTDDGANTRRGLPDAFHIDNANMATPPDGRRPTMQMYLQHAPHTAYPGGDPFSPTNVGDEADTVYHEYTHGLSNRLNVDVQGRSTLGGVQAGAMGEAWSDWYAMDYLVDRHLQRDVRSKADVRLFRYDGIGVNFDRTEPIDCQVGQHARLCTGGRTGHRGGYTYADYAKVVGGAEVHGDGEIWAQTLWSLRYRLGSRKTELLVTRAMELAPYNPSFLDMRNAILVADMSRYGGHDLHAIWTVFASRGMGFSAGTLGAGDTSPGAAFDLPPAQTQPRTITGTVEDGDTHQPIVGATVTLAFQGSGVANPSTTTDGSGHYSLTGIPEGTYAKLQVQNAHYHEQQNVTVGASGATVDFSPRFDWAWSANGGRVSDFTGADYSGFGCGPGSAADDSLAFGWSTNVGQGMDDRPTGTFHPKQVTVRLRQPVEVADFAVDPTATCGDDETSSTRAFRIQTSPTGNAGSWTLAAQGSFTSADNGRLTVVALTAGQSAVRYVRFWIESNQTPNFATTCPSGGVSGCRFADLTELAVYGVPSP
ncbi:MAG: M36 family metallopeptidase [Nocardioides sp.]|nr:M36 family metallopeptidase [Nocardioides sp.]